MIPGAHTLGRVMLFDAAARQIQLRRIYPSHFRLLPLTLSLSHCRVVSALQRVANLQLCVNYVSAKRGFTHLNTHTPKG